MVPTEHFLSSLLEVPVEALLLGFGALVLCLNLYASVKLLRSGLYDRQQKRTQGVLIWLVPLFGSILVLVVMSGQQTRSGPAKPTRSDEDGYSLKYSGWGPGADGRTRGGGDGGGGDGGGGG